MKYPEILWGVYHKLMNGREAILFPVSYEQAYKVAKKRLR